MVTESLAQVVITAVVSLLLASGVWWLRERRLVRLRRILAQINALSELILSSRAPAEMVRRLEAELESTLGVSAVRIFAYSRDSGALEPVGHSAASLPIGTEGKDKAPAVRCYESGDPIAVNDAAASPRGVLCLPMFAQTELDGVLQLEFEKGMQSLDQDERAALQHLANQAAIALKLLDQQFLREQILRGEKLGAAGQLISGVAQELRSPLELIAERAQRLLARGLEPALDRELRAISADTAKASDTLARLVSFTRGEQSRARPLALNPLLRNLVEFRAQPWRMKGISGVPSYSPEEPVVLGSQGQVEQALLSLLLHAEQSVERAPERRIEVATRVRANSALVEIDYSAAALPDTDAGSGAWGLDVCRGIFENHGGSFQNRSAAGRSRVEVELPLAQAGALTTAPVRSASAPTRALTLMLVEPDISGQRYLVNLLGARNHRVVTALSGSDALDLSQRLRFDAVICSTRLPDIAWVELCERVRRHTGSLVVLVEDIGFNSASLSVPDIHLLQKPVEDEALDRVLVLLAAVPAG
jgi:signal transduction histidine kinase/CheY-like chemotaxis protein